MKTPAHAPTLLSSLAIVLLATAVGLSSSCTDSTSAQRPASRSLESTRSESDGGQLSSAAIETVAATGVVARYPLSTPSPGVFKPAWVLYSDLGSDTSSPIVRLVLKGVETSEGARFDIGSFDGVVATVEGTRQVPPDVMLGGGWLPRSLRFAQRVRVTSIARASETATLHAPSPTSLVQAGYWYRDERRLRILLAFNHIGRLGEQGISKAESAAGRRVRRPASPLVGRLVGSTGSLGTGRRGSVSRFELVYDSGITVTEDSGWTINIRSRVRNSRHQRTPPPLVSERLVVVNGHDGLIGYRRSAPGGKSYPAYVIFTDDAIRRVTYWGTPGKGPSEAQLIEIARSI